MKLLSTKRHGARIFAPLVILGIAVHVGGDATGTDIETVVLPERGICAHRGASRTHPENTIAAFKEAIRLGVHQIEFDVWLTKDKQLVVIHDGSVDRTTNGTGSVSELTIDEIHKLDAGSWKDARFTGERIPTLAETLSIMPANIWLNVHLKGETEIGAKVAEEIVHQKRLHQAFLAANRAASHAARLVEPRILVCNMQNQGHDAQYVSDTIAHGDHFLQLLSGMASPNDMRRLDSAAVRVNYCCTNDPQSLKQLFDAGVQFPLVDDVATMMNHAAKLGIEPLVPDFLKDSKSK